MLTVPTTKSETIMSPHAAQFKQLEPQFFQQFGESSEPIRYFFSPGRINLIGEHIDYCGGKVFPASIQMGTFAIARKTDQPNIVMKSTAMENLVSFPVEKPVFDEADGWGNYPKGIFAEYRERGVVSTGLEILFYGNVAGGGLSSSASIQVCTATVIEAYNNFHLEIDSFANKQQIAWLCQHSENHFNGLNCGIMDQGAIALGQNEKAMLMDCRNLDIEYIPVELGDYRLLIGNTCKPRKLVESKYNERREETEKSLELLKPHFSIEHLCDLSMNQLESALTIVTDPILQKRTRHIVSENHRVHQAAEALKQGKLQEFGTLLKASHDSLRDDYEVSGIELDTLVAASLEHSGVLGARMTGAGFGGCMIALVHQDQIEHFKPTVSQAYESVIGYKPEFYETTVGPGAHEVTDLN